MTPLPSTGLHYGVPFEQYKLWDAANFSTIKHMAESPLHCRYEKENPHHSDEMDVGSALHIRTFEPARFEKEFFIAPEYDGRTKEGKAIAADAEFEAAGRTVLRRKASENAVDADSVEGMSQSLWSYAPARRLLEMPGQCEVSALWQDSITGLMCKARFDKLANHPSKRNAIVELKSCRKGFASTSAFGREAAKRYYNAQAAYYLWGLKEISSEPALHVYIVAENVAPYAANWGVLDDAALQSGAIQFRNWLNLYAECVKSGKWPGYPESPTPIISLPNWANRVEMED